MMENLLVFYYIKNCIKIMKFSGLCFGGEGGERREYIMLEAQNMEN